MPSRPDARAADSAAGTARTFRPEPTRMSLPVSGSSRIPYFLTATETTAKSDVGSALASLTGATPSALAAALPGPNAAANSSRLTENLLTALSQNISHGIRSGKCFRAALCGRAHVKPDASTSEKVETILKIPYAVQRRRRRRSQRSPTTPLPNRASGLGSGTALKSLAGADQNDMWLTVGWFPPLLSIPAVL